MPRRAGRSRYQRQALTGADYQQQIIDSEEDKTMTDTQPKPPDPNPPQPPNGPNGPPAEPEDEDQPEAPEEEDEDKPAPA
jgi:hypothetical protein